MAAPEDGLCIDRAGRYAGIFEGYEGWRRGQLNMRPGLLHGDQNALWKCRLPQVQEAGKVSTDFGQLLLGYTLLPTRMQGQEAALLVGLS